MTKPRYPMGCAAGSQERGQASSPSDYAWNVNFNNGNVNNNNQNNSGFVVACRRVPAGECPDATVTMRDLYRAWRRARRRKQPSTNQARFESRWSEELLDLVDELNAGAWSPAAPTCFITRKPKAREIHAPDFRDRVVHHWLVPQLERVYEPKFIHDSFANRTDKGTHAAVRRLRDFGRQVDGGQGGGWYLQLDVHNFFNAIHRPTLYGLLKKQAERAGLPLVTRRAIHALLRRSPTASGVHYRATLEERALVPMHKRLANAPPGSGLAIGNLTSQFFANVYLNELDHFVKHRLKVQRYVRYVDDFVLVHHDRQQLVLWQSQIARFLREQLRLELKAEMKLRPLSAGIDFLGYVIHPKRIRVRRRVVAHARESLNAWARQHVAGAELRGSPAAFRQILAKWRSYEGHFLHADSQQLRRDFHRRFPWLQAATVARRFHHRLEDQRLVVAAACAP